MKASMLMEMKMGFVSSERVDTQATIGSLGLQRFGPHPGAKPGSLLPTRSLVSTQATLTDSLFYLTSTHNHRSTMPIP